MITIFNRKEVYSTYSIESQARARAALEHHGNDYVISTTAGMARNYGSGPIATSRFGTDPRSSTQYRIFVKKKDIDLAAAAIEGKLDRL